MYAVARNLRISHKKANLVAGLVRRQNVDKALAILANTQKKAAGMLAKVIASAAANAVNNFKQNRKDLFIKEIVVTEGMTLKRSVPISRGRMHPILKRSSHVTIRLESKEEVKKTVKKTEEPKVEEVKVTEAPKKVKKVTKAKQ